MDSYAFARKTIAALLLFFLIPLTATAQESPPPVGSQTVEIFLQNVIHFLPDSAGKFETSTVRSADNGRVILSDIDLPNYESSVKIIAYVAIHPIPQDMRSVYDRWDRAGNVRGPSDPVE